MLKNYYISSFFWSTTQRILSAILGFISVPLLLGYFGKADYGILAIATSCNGYMHLLDMGMNIGAIKFFSQWRQEGKHELIYRVSRTNISFYLIISVINILGLLFLATWGEKFFSVTHEQFLQLRWCLYILCLFSPISWVTTAFNQLLVSDKRIAYTMKAQCFQTVFKALLLIAVLFGHISLTTYYFCFTAILAYLILPYSYKCLKNNLIDVIKPASYWRDFRVVLTFSLSIFALSIFQVTAAQSRPIILSICASNAAETVADFRILEVMPNLIIMIGGQFAAIFLPQASSLITAKNQQAINEFAYKWTILTSVISNILCFPFILCAKEVLIAYVGEDYQYLSVWLIIWCITVLSYIHTTPGNSLVLASGKTRILVIITAVSCMFSIAINVFLCKYFEVGSAIIAYMIHVVITTGIYYVYYYKSVLGLSRFKMIKCFAKPTILAVIALCAVCYIVPSDFNFRNSMSPRIYYILISVIKTMCWMIVYSVLLCTLKVVDLTMITNKLKR